MSKAASIEEIFPLSPLQKGLLFHTLFEPSEAVYFEQLTCELHGRFDEAAFAETWRLLVSRHPILRTAFVWKGQREPVQVVHRTLEMPWRKEDWRTFSPAQQAEKLTAFLAEDRKRGFEPNRAPLMRLATLRLSETVWQLVWSHHHLLLDGWSLPLLLREFGVAYAAFSTGQTPALPPARPFGAYLQWLQKRDASRDEHFWREQLRGFSVPTPLTVDKPGPAGKVHEVIDFAIDETDTARLQQIAREQQVTLNTLSQGAYALVLSRYASAEDVVFGVTVSGRPADLNGVENIVGLFINTLPLRVTVTDDAEAGPWLRALQERQVALQEHGHAALSDIQGWSAVPRGQQLFESLFVFINYPVDSALSNRFGDLEPRQVHFVEQTSYPLTIDVLPGPRLTLRTSFDTARFDRETVLRLLGHIRQALLSLGRPGVKLGQIELVAGAERAALLAASTPTAPVEDLRDGSLHAWFARQAATTPDGIALSSESGTLTYAELDRAANAIAHRLRGLGVQRGTLVGLFLERDAPLLVGLLGILKAGGAYLPLDPIYPDDRLDYTIEDSAIPVIITSSELSARLSNPMVMRLELDAGCLFPAEGEECSPLPVVNSPEDPAYVIYTSGSTGRPKGCIVTHRNVLRLFTATEVWYDFNPSDVWTFFHSAAFDFSVWEIWGALLYGGRLVVVPYFTSREPSAFCDLLIRERVTILNQTPSAFRQLMKAEEQVADPRALSLRYVIFGGEALEFASLRSWFERHGDTQPQLVNMYGITETTVFTTYRPLRQADAYEGRGSLIGKPIIDTPLLVLDSRGHLCPIGVPGELNVAGISLAVGYLNRPELTAQRFVPDPHGVSANGKLYRSGDLARRLADGDLDYLGRIDDQVKIRGFRIELGEIENVLLMHPEVREAVVLARADSPGAEKRLVAYVVPRGDERLTVDGMRDQLLTRLPEYMVPSSLVVLDAFPLTANGKIDRRALPEPSGLLADVSAEHVEPRTERERILAEIWSTTLGVERVGVTASYFALGGDSIMGITVCSRARERGIEFSLQDLFEKQTIAALAAETDGAESGAAGFATSVAPTEAASGAPASASSPKAEAASLAPFALLSAGDRARLPGGIEDAYPVTRLQAGMLFHSQSDSGGALYHDVFSHHLRGPLDLGALQQELDALVQRHAVLRTSFDLATFSEPLQIVHAQARWPLVSGDLAHLAPAAQEEWLDRFVHDEAQRAFDWSRPPLVRAYVHRRGPDEFQFTLALHHAIVDGWTLASLLTELFQHYLARIGKGDAPVPAPAIPVAYRDYVALERAALADAATRRFWEQALEGAELLELPRPGPGGSPRPGMVQRPLAIPAALSTALTRVAEGLGVPLKSVLLAAHARVLAALGGNHDVVTGLVTNGRPEVAGAERIAGLFLNTVPFRVRLEQVTSWTDLVRAVFAAETALLPHRRLPLAEIQKRQGGAPLFATDFNFVHFHVYDALGGLSALERLGTRAREETNFTIAVNFGVDPKDGSLGGMAACSAEALDARLIEALPVLFRRVLEAIAEAPTAEWRSLPLLTAPQRAAAFQEAVGESVDFAEDGRSLAALVSAQVARTPQAPAVVSERETLSYAELERRANQLAHWLCRRGVRRDDRVAIALERSTDLVVALLGVLKAGAAYVPIDPSYPAGRVAEMVSDSTARLVLAETRAIATGAVEWRSVWPEIAREATTAPTIDISPAQLAYVIFTSGSTGRPKGVAVSHSAIVNHMAWMQATFPLSAADAVLQKTPVSFDASVWEFWAPLLAGARLVMARPGGQHDPAYLAEAVRAHGITVLQLVPSVLDFFIEEAVRGGGSRLRRVFSGGEALRSATRDRFLTALPEVDLINLYGPAEATIDATFARCAAEGEVSLGAPVANAEVYLLGPDLEPVLPGVAGELCIGGALLARGYLGQAALTAERFIPHPFSPVPGARLYRTGDLARRGEDGRLYFIGRRDGQIKVRGQRVELGELESRLAVLPDVAAAAAAVHEAASGGRQIVAYVVAPTAFAEAEALASLRAILPDALMPTRIVRLDRMPLTPGGKLDRRALPAPEVEAVSSRGARTAPRTDAERAVAQAWCRTLAVREAFLEDDFFHAGGDSILSLRLVSLLAQAGWRLGAADVFGSPTLAGLAARLRPLSATTADLQYDAADVPLTPIQREFFALGAPTPGYWNQAVAVTTRPEVGFAALRDAWRAVLTRHAAFRLRFERSGQAWRQRLVEVADAIPDLAEVKAPAPGAAAMAAAMAREAAALQRSLQLESGPVVRACWIAGSAGERGRLIAVAHHLVIDAVSWRIIFADVASALLGEAVPPVAVPFPAWAAAGARRDFSAARDFWRSEAARKAAALPSDVAAGVADNRESEAGSVSVILPRMETVRLLERSGVRARSRIDEMLLSALLAAVQEWTARTTVRVNLESHGRDALGETIDVSRTVGWFTALYPVTLETTPDATPAERLADVKERVRAATAHGPAYGWLRHGAGGEALAAPAEISFNYLGRLDLALEAEGPFAPAAEPIGPDHSPDSPRAHALDITAAVGNEGLRIECAFGTRRHRRETIERLLARMLRELHDLAAQLADDAGGRWTPAPSDFPLARLDRPQLAALLAERADVEDVWTLAPLQEGMLVHALHEGVAGVYTQQLVIEIAGEMDESRLRAAWQQVMRRHSILRVAFAWDGLAEPRQVVASSLEVDWTTQDWSTRPAGDREAAWADWLEQDRRRGFDLSHAPLWRVAWCRFGPATGRLVFTHHHLLLDGWSLPLLLRDLKLAWSRQPLPPGASYRDFVAWLARREPAVAEAFWRRTLAGVSEAPPLRLGEPPTRPAPAGVSHASARVVLEGAEHAALLRFVRQSGLTLSTCVQAAWGLVLGRHLGVDEAVIGVVVSGRPEDLAGVDGIVGLFINTLPIRVPVVAPETVRAWLRRLQDSSVGLRAHQSSRLVDVLGWSGLPRGRALFETALVFENYPLGAAEEGTAEGLRFGRISAHEQTNFPLTIYAEPGEQLVLRFDYAVDRFTDGAIRSVAEQMRQVLAQLAVEAERPVAAVSLVAPDESQRLAAMGDFHPRDGWDRRAVHQRVAEQAQRSPNAAAIVACGMDGAEAASLTRGDLEVRAGKLAQVLAARGAGPGRLVGVCLERSPEMVVALLAILKTGAAYVPLDPGFPLARLQAMQEESGLTLVVTEQAQAARAGLFPARVQRVLVDAEAFAIAAAPVWATPHESQPDELAYVIFTSGSTGRPKGVQVTHGALANFLGHFAESPGMTEKDVILAVTTLSFDIAGLELFLPLVTGARLALASRETAADASRLGAALVRSGATILQATPATWRLLLAAEWRPPVKLQAWCGGEAMPGDLAAALLERGCELWNLYGPTETTIWSTTRRVTAAADATFVGAPIAHTLVRILDAGLHPVPIGVAGQLFIGGDGLARGYLGRPDLTAERFVPDPFGVPGSRLYATGDLVRRTTAGEIEFLGRIDQQVKLRGFRIELAEIETAMREYVGVTGAAVALREDRPGDKRLVGYLVASPAPDLVALRAALRDRLPDYMVPATFVLLSQLPLTPNGKLDRRALPVPAEDALSPDFVAPRDDVEKAIAAVMQEILGAARVGATDNFFDLGGHSLLAAQVLARVRQVFQIELPLRVFFETATPERIARALVAAETAPGRARRTAQVWLQVRALSPEDRARLLAQRRSPNS
jgi:amino acid adenylation domain-containing protein/non-ribosomal peptide synthase protein (TIGR01720 family)